MSQQRLQTVDGNTTLCLQKYAPVADEATAWQMIQEDLRAAGAAPQPAHGEPVAPAMAAAAQDEEEEHEQLDDEDIYGGASGGDDPTSTCVGYSSDVNHANVAMCCMQTVVVNKAHV